MATISFTEFHSRAITISYDRKLRKSKITERKNTFQGNEQKVHICEIGIHEWKNGNSSLPMATYTENDYTDILVHETLSCSCVRNFCRFEIKRIVETTLK